MDSAKTVVDPSLSCFEETDPRASDLQEVEDAPKSKVPIYVLVVAEGSMFAALIVLSLFFSLFAPRGFWILLPFTIVQFLPLFVALFFLFTADDFSDNRRLFFFICHGFVAFWESGMAIGVFQWATIFWKLRPETRAPEATLNTQKSVLGTILVVHATLQLVISVVVICRKTVEEFQFEKPPESSAISSLSRTSSFERILMSPVESLTDFSGVLDIDQKRFAVSLNAENNIFQIFHGSSHSLWRPLGFLELLLPPRAELHELRLQEDDQVPRADVQGRQQARDGRGRNARSSIADKCAIRALFKHYQHPEFYAQFREILAAGHQLYSKISVELVLTSV
ncbi:hypothetical protein L596_023083 [Steinernema carpocapsae]|uniref:Uncharacterized protein n=1 Tax=Steinernema carpocapsae TaxID=34508 RepID=A0A4U5MCK0_STECR|nr:hypothetical protein L596_023083 [Steinernema carpocapsae]